MNKTKAEIDAESNENKKDKKSGAIELASCETANDCNPCWECGVSCTLEKTV